MSHQIETSLLDVAALAAAVKELQWYTGAGGYQVAEVQVTDHRAVWRLSPQPAAEEHTLTPAAAKAPERRLVEPGDQVVVETKFAQMARRFGGASGEGVEGTVFRVLTRGPHPHGMKVELRDRTVGRVKRNLTAPGAGEPTRDD